MDSIQITARVSPGMVARLDKYAAEHRWSRATAVGALLEHALADLEHDAGGTT